MLHECYGNLFNETENDMGKQGRSYASYYVEAAEWADKCHVPTSDEYVLNGLATCACGLLMAAFFLGLDEVAEVAGVEEYEWLKSTRASNYGLHFIQENGNRADLAANTINKQFSSKRKFPLTLWGCSFASFPFHKRYATSMCIAEFESYSRQVEELKENVKDMLMTSKADPVQNIEFINLLCRLGVSYHFDSEIENNLTEIFDDLPNLLEKHDYDLYTLSLYFVY
uniref:Terpene synthase N-terminal domain-containing protein n=1 Tax=Salix viminalis TaxID=40686 RepID=A0A6N2LMZ8_SALVM